MPEIKGYTRAWKWMADVGADRSRVWGLEVNDQVNILLYEMTDKVSINNPIANATPAQVWSTEVFRWYTAIVRVTSASALNQGLAVLICSTLLF